MTLQSIEVTKTNGAYTEPLWIPADDARRKANSYLARYVSTGYSAIDPELLILDTPVWQVLVQYKTPNLGPIRMGLLDVDAITGEIVPFTTDQIAAIRNRASAFVRLNTSPSTIRN